MRKQRRRSAHRGQSSFIIYVIPHTLSNKRLSYCKGKGVWYNVKLDWSLWISFAVTAKLITAFVFATRIVQSLYFLNPEFQASCNLLWLYSPVCVGPGRKPRRPVFSQRGSFYCLRLSLFCISVLTVPNPCANNPCVYGSCHHTGASYSCQCTNGYTGKNCDQGNVSRLVHHHGNCDIICMF